MLLVSTKASGLTETFESVLTTSASTNNVFYHIVETSDTVLRTDGKSYCFEADVQSCEYCKTISGESKYHKGTCANCGAPLKL